MSSMDPAELVKQPQDVTENPYRKSRKEAQKTKAPLCAEVPLPSPLRVSLPEFRELRTAFGFNRGIFLSKTLRVLWKLFASTKLYRCNAREFVTVCPFSQLYPGLYQKELSSFCSRILMLSLLMLFKGGSVPLREKANSLYIL